MKDECQEPTISVTQISVFWGRSGNIFVSVTFTSYFLKIRKGMLCLIKARQENGE
jgi:hypothetical protein